MHGDKPYTCKFYFCQQGQRAKLLKIVLVEEGWCELVRASKDIASVHVWAHLVADVEFFQQFPRGGWKSLLMQRYTMGPLSAACLMELGIRNYAVDDVKTLEIRLYGEYYNEILKLDLQIGQIIREMIDDYDDAAALSVADMKDDVVNPIIADQYKVLALLAEQIANSKVDIETINGKIAALDARKREIGEAIMASRSSTV
ncbi:hypothetical protein M0412_12995 [Agrobacterium sp. O3.4]|uniref:Uncharacterized protein n=2 Tax=Rhizobium/Agrobacterium group TaxID=227290 RepID=A0A546XGD4_RHIRH|nr:MULTISPECIES: hypothetical protein [Rhizobium/Agrobacterium group]MCZ7468600.1 hypothetical protein [Rhizobium rhizogenes]TRA99823.1 hypothetical protein EXN68_15360 [Rhizobium rhizogenes]WHO10680.1 hypothetical protein KZ699_19490 [Agrobacterium cucumeris]